MLSNILIDMLTCEFCQKQFDNHRKLNGHKSVHQTTRRGKSKKTDGLLTTYQLRQSRKNNHDCKYCGLEFETGPKLGSHIIACKERPDYEAIKQKIASKNRSINARPEVREKISKSNQQFLEQNPHMIPYLRNHSGKKSFPEVLFQKILEENKIEGWIYNYRVGRYVYDFAFPDLKLDVEIDGQQHLSERGILHDAKRDEYSRSLGWEVLRISAKDVKDKDVSYLIVRRIKDLIQQLKGL